MLAAKRRSGNQIFAHRQSPDDDWVETNFSDEARRDINSVRVVAGDWNSDEFSLPVRTGFCALNNCSIIAGGIVKSRLLAFAMNISGAAP